jgi:hypothetical protein
MIAIAHQSLANRTVEDEPDCLMRYLTLEALVAELSVTAYHSFGGEVGSLEHPTMRALAPHAVTNFRE